MKIPKIHPAVYVIGAIGAAYAIYRVVDAIMNPNRGTAFEGAGAVGTLGNITNQVLGGVPAKVGESIGEALFNLTHKEYENADTLIFTFKSTGKKGAVNADEVDASTGLFTYFRDGKKYKLQKDATGNRVAVSA